MQGRLDRHQRTSPAALLQAPQAPLQHGDLDGRAGVETFGAVDQLLRELTLQARPLSHLVQQQT